MDYPANIAEQVLLAVYDREQAKLPCDVIRVGDRQYGELEVLFEQVYDAYKQAPEYYPGVDPNRLPWTGDHVAGIPLERVESPDYFYVGARN